MTEVFVVESATYYEAEPSTLCSIHRTYAGALSAAGRCMTRLDFSRGDCATRTDYRRVQPHYDDVLDEWDSGGGMVTLKRIEVQA